MKTETFISNANTPAFETYGQPFSADAENNLEKTPPVKFEVSTEVEIKTRAGEDPRELHRRFLLEAASEAGLDGTGKQAEFVEKWIKSGISFPDKAADPSPSNDLSVKSADIKGDWLKYKLSEREIADLRRLQKEFIAEGGKLSRGKTYETTSEGEVFSLSRRGKTLARPLTDAQYEARKMRELWEQAQIPTASIFGTPAKLRDLKHVPGVTLSSATDLSAEDRALLGYINKQYGGGNLWGDKQREILFLAKEKGVRIENLSVDGSNASFDISVENLLKLHITYINVQQQVNASEELVNAARDKMALNQFLIGAGEGAWGALKANYKIIRHPVETYENIKEALGILANLTQEDLLKIYETLKAEGHKFIFEKDISEASRDVGNVVGAALVEFILGKGIGAGLKALRGLKSVQSILSEANQLKQSINKLPVPTPSVKVVVDTTGNKIFIPDIELKKLEDLIQPLESRAAQVLSGAKKAVNLPAWEKLSFKLDPDGSVHFLSGHKKGGNRLLNSVKDGGNKDVFPEWMSDNQIIAAVREAYKNSKKVKTQTLFGEEKVKLIGESNGLRIEIWVNLTTKTLETAYPVR